MRRQFKIDPITVNNKEIGLVVIDPHVDKHSDHINDDLVLKVVRLLDGESFLPKSIKDGFSYFASELRYQNNWYKLVWLLEDKEIYIGVITLYKDRRLK